MPLSYKEEKILKSIIVASENDPRRPEFPPDNPKFPATPTQRINVPGFSNVWLKDESKNPTGTHKDRMAWEMVVTYRDFLLAKKKGLIQKKLPHFSLISSGSAALAIQFQLRRYNLPSLKVLVDSHLSKDVRSVLERMGCELYDADLLRTVLSCREILALTENLEGFDITSSDALDPTTRYYDWLSYEILNQSSEYCFIPFGTGYLYQNILNIAKKEACGRTSDPRFGGKKDILRRCHFFGATTNNPRSKAEKLYSPHLPFTHYDEQWIRLYKQAGYCGKESGVHSIKEEYLEKAYLLTTKQGIECEYSGIAGLALLLGMKKHIQKNKKILIVNTGKTKYHLFENTQGKQHRR